MKVNNVVDRYVSKASLPDSTAAQPPDADSGEQARRQQFAEVAIALFSQEGFSLDALPQERERRENLEQHASNLEQETRVKLHRVPKEVYPGMPYTTPAELVSTEKTKYSLDHLLLLARKKVVTSCRVADRVIFDAAAVEELFQYEQRTQAVNEGAGGRRAGRRRAQQQAEELARLREQLEHAQRRLAQIEPESPAPGPTNPLHGAPTT